MLEYGEAVILGKREFQNAIKSLPARVVQKIMDEWTLKQAQALATIAKRSAPRDRRPGRSQRKSESERLWRSIRASKVRRLRRFPHTVSRAIAYGASVRGAVSRSRANRRLSKRNERRVRRGLAPKTMGKKARHFHLVVLGTKPRMQYSTGRKTGSMWGRTANPQFWQRSTRIVTANAQGEVGAQLRDAYDRGIQKEIKRLERKYL